MAQDTSFEKERNRNDFRAVSEGPGLWTRFHDPDREEKVIREGGDLLHPGDVVPCKVNG